VKVVAPGVRVIELARMNLVRAYLVGDLLVDAGLGFHANRVLGALRSAGVRVARHVITHAHVDHVGGLASLVRVTGAPVYIGSGERGYAESGAPPYHPGLDRVGLGCVAKAITRFESFPVAGVLAEGDHVGHGFVVVETPGHSPGHISLWREADRVLIAGDAVAGQAAITLRPGLVEPPEIFTFDRRRSRESIRRLAELEPSIVLFGHGPPVTSAAEALSRFAASLPS